jgi:hypothetical protein
MRPPFLPLPIPNQFAQNHGMEKPTEPAEGFWGLVQWARTPPQSVAVYFVILVLVLGMSFYAGTLSPKKPAGTAPPPASAPRN